MSSDHFTVTVEVRQVRFLAKKKQGLLGEALAGDERLVEEVARVVVRGASEDEVLGKAVRHLQLMEEEAVVQGLPQDTGPFRSAADSIDEGDA